MRPPLFFFYLNLFVKGESEKQKGKERGKPGTSFGGVPQTH